MTAEEHARAAEEHRAEASEHRAQYDPSATSRQRTLYPPPAEDPIGLYDSDSAPSSEYNPTAHHLTDAERHERIARQHAAAASGIVEYAEGACRSLSPAVRSSCPLLGQLARVERLANGARLVAKPGVDVDAWQRHVACFMAYMQTRPGGEASCPLSLRRVRAEAVGNTVELTSADAETATRLFELARAHAD